MFPMSQDGTLCLIVSKEEEEESTADEQSSSRTNNPKYLEYSNQIHMDKYICNKNE
jgi:hypothetical protein